MKALIYVRGGNVISVTSDSPDFQYKIIDYDNFEAESEGEEKSWIETSFLEPDLVEEITD